MLNCFNYVENRKKGKNYAPREQDNSEIRMLGNWNPGDWK